MPKHRYWGQIKDPLYILPNPDINRGLFANTLRTFHDDEESNKTMELESFLNFYRDLHSDYMNYENNKKSCSSAKSGNLLKSYTNSVKAFNKIEYVIIPLDLVVGIMREFGYTYGKKTPLSMVPTQFIDRGPIQRLFKYDLNTGNFLDELGNKLDVNTLYLNIVKFIKENPSIVFPYFLSWKQLTLETQLFNFLKKERNGKPSKYWYFTVLPSTNTRSE